MDNGKLSSELNLYLNFKNRIEGEVIGENENISSDYVELIVKFSGDLSFVESELSGVYTELLGGYGIIVIPTENIPLLSSYRQIEYVELPRRLFFELNEAIPASCITPVQRSPLSLTGKGVLVAIIDSGIDYSHPDFINDDNTTRIVRLFDQTTGIIYDSSDINLALSLPENERRNIVNETDVSGHGTHVAAIAAGNGRASGGLYKGAAPECSLLIVKLGSSIGDSFPKTTNLMTAMDYIIRTSIELNMPVAINISFGNTYGPHDGTSILENFINICAGYSRTSVIIGMGNEGAAAGHASGRVYAEGIFPNNPASDMFTDFKNYAELSIGTFERYLSLQLWKNYYDEFTISLTSPAGVRREISPVPGGAAEYDFPGVTVLVYNAMPTPISTQQEFLFVFVPKDTYLPSGIWRFDFSALSITSGRYDMYLPSSGALNPGTVFLSPDPYVTLTNPAGSYYSISVGAYNSFSNSYADFSGRGYTRSNIITKPDICAPGVNITSAAPGGGYTVKSGTSMAAPFVSGSAALLMEWGIINGNDAYLYGEKLKAFLIRGARRLPGYTEWPNRLFGYGALCLKNSIPT